MPTPHWSCIPRLFQSMADVDAQTIARCRTELDDGDYHPMAEASSAFLRRFAVALSANGQFSGPGKPNQQGVNPCIGRAPLLFLRPRTQGFSRAIEGVLRKAAARRDFNSALHSVVGIERIQDAGEPTGDGGPRTTPETPDPDVYFAKDANPEQLRIAQRMQQHGAVLVQGPPGTGKSHTIANLIGHLLATHKSVLVTSHTTKAGAVLRDHVVSELRPLCVSALESDLESRQQLEASVVAISTWLSDSDVDAIEKQAATLQRTRRSWITKLEELQTELLRVRSDEYREVVVAGKAYLPSKAARIVAAGKGVHDWIPGPVQLGEPSRSRLKKSNHYTRRTRLAARKMICMWTRHCLARRNLAGGSEGNAICALGTSAERAPKSKAVGRVKTCYQAYRANRVAHPSIPKCSGSRRRNGRPRVRSHR